MGKRKYQPTQVPGRMGQMQRSAVEASMGSLPGNPDGVDSLDMKGRAAELLESGHYHPGRNLVWECTVVVVASAVESA